MSDFYSISSHIDRIINSFNGCSFECPNDPPQRKSNESYSVGDIIIPNDPNYNGYQYKCVENNQQLYGLQRKPRTSSQSPNWNQDIIIDGEIIWKRDQITPRCKAIMKLLHLSSIEDIESEVIKFIAMHQAVSDFYSVQTRNLSDRMASAVLSVSGMGLPAEGVVDFSEFGEDPIYPNSPLANQLKNNINNTESHLLEQIICNPDNDLLSDALKSIIDGIGDVKSGLKSLADFIDSFSVNNVIDSIKNTLSNIAISLESQFTIDYNIDPCNFETNEQPTCRTEEGRNCICMKLSSIFSSDSIGEFRRLSRDYHTYRMRG